MNAVINFIKMQELGKRKNIKWRPVNWVEYAPYLATIHTDKDKAFEEGADAMLEALKKEGMLKEDLDNNIVYYGMDI